MQSGVKNCVVGCNFSYDEEISFRTNSVPIYNANNSVLSLEDCDIWYGTFGKVSGETYIIAHAIVYDAKPNVTHGIYIGHFVTDIPMKKTISISFSKAW